MSRESMVRLTRFDPPWQSSLRLVEYRDIGVVGSTVLAEEIGGRILDLGGVVNEALGTYRQTLMLWSCVFSAIPRGLTGQPRSFWPS